MILRDEIQVRLLFLYLNTLALSAIVLRNPIVLKLLKELKIN
jgi:hypothetical protein